MPLIKYHMGHAHRTHLYEISTTLITQLLQYHLLLQEPQYLAETTCSLLQMSIFIALKHFSKRWIFFSNLTEKIKLIKLLSKLLDLLLSLKFRFPQ